MTIVTQKDREILHEEIRSLLSRGMKPELLEEWLVAIVRLEVVNLSGDRTCDSKP
jgi:hypothetical protein